MSAPVFLLLAFGLGAVTGLRAMLALAAVTWAAHLGWISLDGTPLRFLGGTTALVVLTIAALAEIVNDKLPWTPARTKLPSLVVRILLGALAAAALAAAGRQSLAVGAVAGALGALAGTFGGYEARKRAVLASGLPDVAIALAEDAVGIAAALLILSLVEPSRFPLIWG
jgi:uncharacterized membrane protein